MFQKHCQTNVIYTFYATIEKCYKNVVFAGAYCEYSAVDIAAQCGGAGCVLYGAPILWGHLVKQKGSLGEKFIYRKKWVFRFPFF